jgi:hypothetical protein
MRLVEVGSARGRAASQAPRATKSAWQRIRPGDLGGLSEADDMQLRKVWRIGFLAPTPASLSSQNTDAFLQGMRELGYVEGKRLAPPDPDALAPIAARRYPSYGFAGKRSR